MADNSFRFQYFTIHQDKCAMKVGTDAVVLGSWVDPGNSTRILDIGTGTGILSLMLAQKSNAIIDAIDIDGNACAQAKENFRISPWFDRLHIHPFSFQEWADKRMYAYDLIISNPPYFHHASKPVESSRLHARHNESLSFTDIIEGVKKILRPRGRLILILPSIEGMEFMDLAQSAGLFCRRMIRVRTRAGKTEKRLIMEFGDQMGILRDEELIIQQEDGTFTEEYIQLTRDYYINLRSIPSSAP